MKQAFPAGIPHSATFTSRSEIASILKAFCRPNFNHTMLPNGGGMDIHDVKYNEADDTLELLDSPQHGYVCRPSAAHFEYIEGFPKDSFFLIENGYLRPSGAYGKADKADHNYEEVVELDGGQFLDRGYWDQGIEGYDENDYEIPLRKSARLLSRFWGGKFLMVDKLGSWNRHNATYDGRHDTMSSVQIRKALEDAF